MSHPSTSSAYGIWSLNEVRDAVRGENWPSVLFPSFRSIASYTTNNTHDETPKTLPMPTGIQVGDLIIVSATSYDFSDDGVATLTTSGWTLVVCDWSNYTYESAVWYKVATASDIDGTLGILQGSNTSATYSNGFVMAIQDVGSSPTVTSAVDIEIPDVTTGGTRNVGVPPTVTSGGLLINFVFDRSGNLVYQQPTADANFVLRDQVSDGSSGTIYTHIATTISSDDFTSSGQSEIIADVQSGWANDSYTAASITLQVLR